MEKIRGRSESGQAMTEYLLILAVVVFLAGTITRSILGVLDKGVLNLGAQLEKDLKTGRANIGLWSN